MKDENLLIRYQKGNLIAKVPASKNRIFQLKIQNDIIKCLKTYVKDNSWLWHMRYGHLNFGGLKLLSSKGMVRGLPLIDHPEQLCEGCLLGKHSREDFPKESANKATKPLEFVHTDVYGPIKPASLGQNSYFLIFVNDFSQKTWVYFLKEKSEVFNRFNSLNCSLKKNVGSK